MEKTITLSTTIGAWVKKAVADFCRRRGIKLQYFVEQALIEQLEDEVDLETYHQRRHEPTISLADIIRTSRKPK